MEKPTPPPMRIVRSGGWLTKTLASPLVWPADEPPPMSKFQAFFNSTKKVNPFQGRIFF